MERHNLFEIKNQNTQDKLSNSFSIYSMGNLNKEISEYELETKIYTNKYTDNLTCLNKASIITSILIIVIFVSLNVMSTYLFLNKQLAFTNLIAIFITIIYYTPCISTIALTMPSLIHYYGSLKNVDNFIKELYETNIPLKKINKPFYPIEKGTIIINNLSFNYENDKNKLFNNFYLTIKDKEKVAILGKSGNGKSTLVKLIMGYYKLSDNSLFIDDKDINSFNLNDLRKQISYVNQNSKLFNKTLLENIQYGNDLTRKDVIELLNKLKINNIFKNFKNGLDTNVGIEGNNLSGGQKQIVHILRCIGKKNKIVILDEPTSAIDHDNKEHVINAIKELSKDSVLIIITHTESIIKFLYYNSSAFI
jgi:ATP-binding cassette subfamily B protein